MVAVRDDKRQTPAHVAPNEQHMRQGFAVVDALEVLVDMRFVAWQERQLRRPQRAAGVFVASRA
jgi:hypothetical protein